jgi:hypothetical protein
MISDEDLKEAARYMDALSEEHGFEALMAMMDVDASGLHYVAGQRALRAAMILDGQDPTKMSRTTKTKIHLSKEVRELLPALTALAMDGIGIGVHAGRQDS